MREIKFRVYNYNLKKMFCHFPNARIDLGLSYYENNIKVSFPMQFTGLKDKNGKEIYEGDLIRINDEKIMQISWSDKFASFIIDRDGWAYSHWFGESCSPGDCDVVGNIHENPELL